MNTELKMTDIIKDIKGFIIKEKYWCKAEGLAKSKWRKQISGRWLQYKDKNKIVSTADDFIKAWQELEQTNGITK